MLPREEDHLLYSVRQAHCLQHELVFPSSRVRLQLFVRLISDVETGVAGDVIPQIPQALDDTTVEHFKAGKRRSGVETLRAII